MNPLPPPNKKFSALPPRPKAATAPAFVESEEMSLFDMDEDWKGEWKGMPEFNQSDLTPFKSVHLHFASFEDLQAFAKLIGQTVTLDTRSIWYPAAEIGRIANKRWVDEA